MVREEFVMISLEAQHATTVGDSTVGRSLSAGTVRSPRIKEAMRPL